MDVAIQTKNGIQQISINGTLYPPLAFRSFRPEQRNVSEFYQSGVRLMSILMTGLNCTLDVPYSPHGEIWIGPKEYDFAAIDRQMNLFLEHAPEAYFNIMLQLDTRDWYLKLHPEYSNSFFNLVEMAGVEGWRADVCEYLQDVIAYLEEKYGDRIFAYSLFCGGSTEWYTNSQSFGNPEGEIRYHPLKEQVYRAYLGNPEAALPSMEQLQHTSVGVFRHPEQDKNALDYWHFHHGIIGDTILFFAKFVKELLNRKKLLGLYYGYIYALPDTRLLYEGQLAYERVLACPDLDMIFAPASYQDRGFTGTSGFLNNADSVGLHGKLQFHEVDHTTYIAPTHVENGREIPGSNLRLADSFQSRMVLRRELCMCLAKRIGMWWFDFFGGYFYAPELMEEVTNMTAIRNRLREVPMSNVSRIAVLSDPESMYYVSEFAKLNNDCLTRMYDHLGRMGAPFDLYNFSDLETMDTAPYRLFILLNVFRMTAAQRQLVEDKLKRNGNHVLWLYAPGYLSETGFDVANMEAVTDMALEEVTQIPSQISCGDCRFGFQTALSPLFAVTDPDAEIWGRYEETGMGALARKVLDTHTSYYCAVGNLHHRILQRIVREAGIHVYYDGDDPVYVNDRLIGIHAATEGGTVTLRLPRDYAAEELFDGGTYTSHDGLLTVEIPKGETKLFLLTECTAQSEGGSQ